MFDSQDYLYCNHASCGRRFCSESALDKHCLLFHGRPTCDLCGGKLKKSSKVGLLSDSVAFAILTVLPVFSIDALYLTVI